PGADDVARKRIRLRAAPACFDPLADFRRGRAELAGMTPHARAKRCRGGPPTVRASIVHDCLHTPPYVGPGRPFVNTGGYGGVGGKTAEAGEHLRAEDWEDAALEALGSSGLAAVNVQSLARTLGVTKGSFYWHFADREALLKATLARWEESYT